MLDPNPYASPKSESVVSPPQGKASDLRSMRIIFYLHLFAIVICVLLSLVDSQQLQLPGVAKTTLTILGIPAFFSWMIFPFAMAMAATRLTNRSVSFCIVIVLLDTGLSVFQLWAMLPLVQ